MRGNKGLSIIITVFCISAVANKETTDGSIAKLLRSCAIVKNVWVKGSFRPARDNVGNQCFAVINSLNVHRIELFPVNESHCIVRIWANNSHEGAIDCSYDTRESCYVVEPSLRLTQLGWNWNELPFMLRNNSWHSVYSLAAPVWWACLASFDVRFSKWRWVC